MTVYQWLCLLGVPAAIGGILGYVVRKFALVNKETEAIRAGIQALLRDRLLQSYRYFSTRGWADEDDRMNWENMYIQYYTLGQDGVMADIRKKFFNLPMTCPNT